MAYRPALQSYAPRTDDLNPGLLGTSVPSTGVRARPDWVRNVRAAAALQEKRKGIAVRAFDKFILSMQRRRGKGTKKQREETNPPTVSERPRGINPNGRH